MVIPFVMVIGLSLAVTGCGGAGRSTEKEAELSGGELEPGERSQQSEETKNEAAELAKNRELLSLLESKRREEAAELNAQRLEAVANKRAKKREAAAARKATEREQAAQESIQHQEAVLKTKISHEEREHETKKRGKTTSPKATPKSVGEPPRVSRQSPSGVKEGT